MTENAAIPALTDEQVKQKTEDILEALRDVVDPELGINVVDLGLIYGVLLDGPDRATLDMTLTSAACPLTDVIEEQAAEALKDTVEDFTINWVWMPPWGPESITDDGREQLRALGFNISFSSISGRGGRGCASARSSARPGKNRWQGRRRAAAPPGAPASRTGENAASPMALVVLTLT